MKKVDNSELNSKEELIKRKDVKNTPFTIITINNKSFGTMGQYRITEETEDIKQLEKELNTITWDRLLQVILILQEQNKEILNLIKE